MNKASKNMAKELTVSDGVKHLILMFSVCREIGSDNQRQELPEIQYTRQ